MRLCWETESHWTSISWPWRTNLTMRRTSWRSTLRPWRTRSSARRWTTRTRNTRLRYSRESTMRSTNASSFTRTRLRNQSKSNDTIFISNLNRYSLETKLYSEKHTKAILDQERHVINKKLLDVRGENQHMNREISRNKMFNKKDENKKLKKEHQDK